MNIILATDDNFVQHCCVTITSVLKSNSGTKFYLFTEGLKETNVVLLDNHVKALGGYLKICKVDSKLVKDFPMPAYMSSHISIATYYRLFVAQILPEDVHKIIYLDGDMIVRGSLDKLWNTDLDGYAIAAVHDMDEQKHIDSHRLPYPMETGYFNAGMQLINVDYWRKNDCLSLFMNFLKEHADKIVYHDQDVLNCCLYDKKKWVSVTYNFQNGFLYNSEHKDYVKGLQREIDDAINDPIIIHFSTYRKPWHINCFHPFCAV